MKSMILAATALVLTSSMAAAAPLSVSRQVLLDGGAVASGLRLEESVTVSALATTTGTCALTWGSNGAPTTHPFATSVPATTDTQTVSTSVTMRASRVNPQGMAIGQAVYNGDWAPAAPSGVTATLQASCPNGGSHQVELTPYIAPQLISAAQQGAIITEATTTTTVDQPCHDARTAFVDAHNAVPGNKNMGYAYGQFCPDIVTSVDAVYGPDIPEVWSEAVLATYATHTYTYEVQNVETTFSNGSGVLDNITFNFTP